MKIYNCHLHTSHSHDAKSTPLEMCEAAVKAGFLGVAFTDHCDIEYYHTWPEREKITASVAAAKQMQEQFAGRLRVFCGIEIGEATWDMQAANEIRSLFDYDIVIGSVHAVHGFREPLSRLTAQEVEAHTYISRYFEDVRQTIATCDFDVLPHLTYPLRYFVGRFGQTVDLDRYAAQIDGILDAIIEKGIALEVNTSCVGTAYDALLPDAEILKQYRKKGGRLLTIGSDAHHADTIANGISRARETLLSVGFTQAYYYDKREPIPYDL